MDTITKIEIRLGRDLEEFEKKLIKMAYDIGFKEGKEDLYSKIKTIVPELNEAS